MNTSEPMAEGIDSAMRSMTTDTRYGSRLRRMMRYTGVPRHREARLYSLSRMMMIWLRINRAMLSQPVKHRAKMMVSMPGLRM